MIDKLIEGLYNFLFGLTGTVTQPISDFLNNNFPDLSTAISTATSFFNSLSNVIAWFVFLIPKPFTIAMFLLFLVGVITLLPLMIEMEIVGKGLDLIKRVNPFGGK